MGPLVIPFVIGGVIAYTIAKVIPSARQQISDGIMDYRIDEVINQWYPGKGPRRQRRGIDDLFLTKNEVHDAYMWLSDSIAEAINTLDIEADRDQRWSIFQSVDWSTAGWVPTIHFFDGKEESLRKSELLSWLNEHKSAGPPSGQPAQQD